ncbi:MAG: SUMF1/EgtB/PvdO family nonheme iron enzyme [Janthinobacterium lividum]
MAARATILPTCNRLTTCGLRSYPKSTNQLRTPPSSKKQNAPVIGVSWQQALAYCEWRSVVATYLHNHSKLDTYQIMLKANAAAKTLITYRLPTEKEWEKSTRRFTDNLRSATGFRCVYSSKKVA